MSKVVLVTGCSAGGIGFALCERFASQGCKVYATARNPDAMQGFGDPKIEKLPLDVTSDDDVMRVVRYIEEAEGRIDIVVNNAGVMGIGPLIDQTMEYTKHVFDTNVFSVVRMSKAVIPIMAKRKSGLIINIGSVVGETPTPWNGLYSASKAALHNLGEVLSMECRPFNISVTTIAPGSITSNISTNSAARFALPAGSLYVQFLPNIVQRMHASQGARSMSAEAFARDVVGKALGGRPPLYYMVGGNTLAFKAFRWIPRAWVLWYFWRLYSKKL